MANNKKNNTNSKSADIEIISPSQSNQVIDLSNQDSIEEVDNNAVSISRDQVQVKKSGNLVIGNMNLVLNPLRKRWRRDYSGRTRPLIIDVFLVFIMITLAAFVYLANNWTSSSKAFSLDISGQNEISAGALSSFELEYKSNEDVENVTAKVFLPSNFIIESVSPQNLFNEKLQTFNLGSINKNSSGKIKINGFVWGEVNDQQDISFKFDCYLCGRNGINSSLFYNIEKPALEDSLQIDETIFQGSDFNGTLTLKNNTNNDIKNIKINLGDNLEIKKSNFKIENKEIILEELKSADSQIIEFSASSLEKETLIINPKFNIEISENIFSFSSLRETKLEIKKPKLNINISSDNNIVSDNKINYNLSYNSEEQSTIKNIEMEVLSANPNFVIDSLTMSNNPKNASLSKNTIFIEDLVDDESGSLSLNVLFDKRQSAPNQELFLKINLKYEVNGQIVEHVAYSNKNKVPSQTTVSALAYYYSPQGDQLGVGPLPPAVNMATNYWVFLEVRNMGNDLENFVLSAELPKNVYFSGNKRVLDGKMFYDENNSRVTWEISAITGDNNSYRANLEITLIPEENDLGKIPTLLNNIKFTAQDSFTKQDLNRSIVNIDTSIKNDKFSNGKGQVISIR